MEDTLQSVPFLSKVYKHATEPVKIMVVTTCTLLLMSTTVLFWSSHTGIISPFVLAVGLIINMVLLVFGILVGKKFTNKVTQSLLEKLRQGTWSKQPGQLIIYEGSKQLRIPITDSDYQTMKIYFGK